MSVEVISTRRIVEQLLAKHAADQQPPQSWWQRVIQWWGREQRTA